MHWCQRQNRTATVAVVTTSSVVAHQIWRITSSTSVVEGICTGECFSNHLNNLQHVTKAMHAGRLTTCFLLGSFN
eukprot:m.262531 g.262531  ORF g.262531 m.262531 type:complete len:75 (+) comp49586_c0_seq1:649-873(+)